MARKLLWTMLLTVVLAVGSAAAQDVELGETQVLDSGTSFSYPDDWDVEADEGTLVVISSDLTRVTLVDYAHFEEAGVVATGQDKSVAWYVNETLGDEVGFDAGEMEEVELGERTARRFDYAFDTGTGGLLLLVPFSGGRFGVVDALSLDGEMQEEDVVLAIAESFDSSEPAAAGRDTETSAAAGEACTVSTGEERTVHVHVGPGENRTSYAFLPANQSFEVLGQAAAADDSLWWKLDREVVAPNAAANEAWVAQEEVETEGDCAAVVDVNAPPVIPIVPAPPPAPAEDSGEQPPSEGETTAPTTTEGSALPSPGTWTVFYNGHIPASCIGEGITQETIYFDTVIPSETYSLTVSGRNFVLGGALLTPIAANRYRGQWNVEIEGINFAADLILTVVSSGQMVGELRFTLVEGGIACSATASITVTRG
jgi:hypothetical protein